MRSRYQEAKAPAERVSFAGRYVTPMSIDRARPGARSVFGARPACRRYSSLKVGARNDSPAPARSSIGALHGRSAAAMAGLTPASWPTTSKRSAGNSETAPRRTSSEIDAEKTPRRWKPVSFPDARSMPAVTEPRTHWRSPIGAPSSTSPLAAEADWSDLGQSGVPSSQSPNAETPRSSMRSRSAQARTEYAAGPAVLRNRAPKRPLRSTSRDRGVGLVAGPGSPRTPSEPWKRTSSSVSLARGHAARSKAEPRRESAFARVNS